MPASSSNVSFAPRKPVTNKTRVGALCKISVTARAPDPDTPSFLSAMTKSGCDALASAAASASSHARLTSLKPISAALLLMSVPTMASSSMTKTRMNPPLCSGSKIHESIKTQKRHIYGSVEMVK